MPAARLRLPFFLLALLAITGVVLVERGAMRTGEAAARLMPFLRSDAAAAFTEGLEVFSPAQADQLQQNQEQLSGLSSDVRGFAIPALQYVDGILLFTVLLMGLALVISPEFHARVQGIITLVFAILLVIAALAMIFAVLARLLLMVALLLSFPFGTIAYLIIYGGFPRAAMNAVLSLLFVFKVGFVALLLAAHQDFLKNVGLVIFVVVAFIAGLVVSFLYGIVPGILVSITDAAAAIVVAIIGIILAIILAVGGIAAAVKAFKG